MIPPHDLLAPEVVADPHRFFCRLAEEDPVHYNARWGGWIVTRHAHVTAALQDARLSSDAFTPLRKRLSEEEQERWPMIFRVLASGMVYRDPPEHTRLRTLVNKAFTRRAVEEVRPSIQTLTDELLDRVEHAGAMDLCRDFAYPLPVAVIARMIGVPDGEGDRIKEWSDDIATLMLGSLDQPDRHERANRGLAEMSAYFRWLVRERRRAPRDDLASALVAAQDQGELLTEDELTAMCGLMVFAGHETTTNLIANAVLALFDHPGERERLAAALEAPLPALLTTAVEELLRYDGPMKAISRTAVAPLEIGGKRVEPGQRVLLVLSAADRDPARFADPHRLDLGRQDNPHVAFGHGIHYCIGAPLARLETAIAIAALLRRLPTLRLAVPRESLSWHDALLVRALRALPVAFG